MLWNGLFIKHSRLLADLKLLDIAPKQVAKRICKSLIRKGRRRRSFDVVEYVSRRVYSLICLKAHVHDITLSSLFVYSTLLSSTPPPALLVTSLVLKTIDFCELD